MSGVLHVGNASTYTQMTFLQYFVFALHFVWDCNLVVTALKMWLFSDDIIHISPVKRDLTMRCWLSNISPSLSFSLSPRLSLFPFGVQTLPNLASPPLTVSMETFSLVVGYRKVCVCVCMCHSHYLGFSWLSAWLRLRQTEIHTLSHLKLLMWDGKRIVCD